jgi:hypothetical protein
MVPTRPTSVARRSAYCLALLWIAFAPAAPACNASPVIREATPAEIRAHFDGQRRTVLTFLGYSGAEYQSKAEMLAHAARVLDRHDPAKTVVNIGATAEGIGAVYEMAKRQGFPTAGVVSTQARDHRVALSPCVDTVFYVRDDSWGGFRPGTEVLSPTSTAMVESSDVLVAIGGGEIARDELIAARRAGKRVEFVPADMSHRIARERALQRGQPEPADFRGAAASAFPHAAAPAPGPK